MNKWHQSGSLQALAGTPRQLHLAGLLRIQAQRAGWLQVASGRVWITRSGDAADHVLAAGEGLWLGTSEQVLAEPWRAGEAADLRWGQTAAAPTQGVARGRGGVWRAAARGLGAAARRLAAAARSAEAMANRAQGSIRPGDSIAPSGALQQPSTARWPVRVA